MITNTPEYLVEEVRNIYGIEVPLETAITYLESDPYLTPDSLYDYVSRNENQTVLPQAAIKLKGYKFVDFDKDEIPLHPGVYMWLLKDNVELPQIEGFTAQYKSVEINGKSYRVLYIGQAKTESLYERVVKKHLKGNPRQSTLCWSLAAIMGMPYTINEKRKPKLDKKYCQELTNWLCNNCFLLYKVIKNTENIDAEEQKQIETFTPPVNLDKNPLKNTDPFIQRVSHYRHVAGGYKSESSNHLGFNKYLSFILTIVGVMAILYFAMK